MSKIGIQTKGSGAVMPQYFRGGGIAKRGTGAALKTGGRAGKFGGGRTNLLEQLGRVEAEPSNLNRRAEISRVHGELNRGYKDGGRIGFRTGKGVVPRRSQPPHKETTIPSRLDSQRKNIRLKAEHAKAEGGRAGHAHGMSAGKQAIKRITERLGGGEEGKPHSTRAGRIAAGVRKIKRGAKKVAEPFVKEATTWEKLRKNKAEGGRIGFRTGTKPSAGQRIKARKAREEEWWTGKRGKHQAMYVPGLDKELREKRPHSSPEGRWGDVKTALAKKRTDRIQADVAKYKRTVPSGRALHKEGGRIGFKEGTDKKWMQKVSASIKKRGTKGKCTPITKPGCTGRAKALAKTFKKIAARRKAA